MAILCNEIANKALELQMEFEACKYLRADQLDEVIDLIMAVQNCSTGTNGVGIISTIDNGDGTFTFNYSDSTSFTTSDLTGPQGLQGLQGIQGLAGNDGTDGYSVLNGTSIPNNFVGKDGDFYIKTDTWDIYGPRTSGSWGSATSLIGPAGINGIDGQGVPAGGSTGQILSKIDGSNYNTQWIDAPTTGTGDMLRSVYDTNNSGVVDNSELVNGLTVLTAVPSGALFTDTTYTDAEIKTKLENNADTNTVTDSQLIDINSISGKLDSVVAGLGVTVDNTDPNNPIIAANVSGLVHSVNSLTGDVLLTTDEINEATNLYFTETRVTNTPAVLANTAKVGITTAQAADIVTNNAKINSVVAGSNVSIDITDPKNPIINLNSSGSGDMLKSVYDTNDNGIVDNSAQLNSQLPSFYLDRTNHTGTQLWTTITGTPTTESGYGITDGFTSWTKDYGDLINTPTIPVIDDTAYGTSWNGNTDGASKNAIYDQMQFKLSAIVGDANPGLGGDLILNGRGFKTLFAAGENLAAGDIVTVNSSFQAIKVGATSIIDDKPLYITLGAVTTGNTGQFLAYGYYTTTGLTAGTKYYLSETDGQLVTNTSTFSSTSIIKYIGTAKTTTLLFFEPSDVEITKDGTTLNGVTLAGSGGGISNIVEDLTPQLGGDLDLNGFTIPGIYKATLLTEITTSTYTLSATDSDGNNILPFNSASAQTITVDNSVHSAGEFITLWREGSGTVEIVPGTGVTFKGVDDGSGQYFINNQYSYVILYCETPSTFHISGNLTVASSGGSYSFTAPLSESGGTVTFDDSAYGKLSGGNIWNGLQQFFDGIYVDAGPISFNDNRLQSVGTPTTGTDAVNKTYGDTNYLPIINDTAPQLGGNLDVNGKHLFASGTSLNIYTSGTQTTPSHQIATFSGSTGADSRVILGDITSAGNGIRIDINDATNILSLGDGLVVNNGTRIVINDNTQTVTIVGDIVDYTPQYKTNTTQTSFTLTNRGGDYFQAGASSQTNLTLTGSYNVGAFVKIWMNTTSQPTVTGATLRSGATWTTGTDFDLVIASDDGTNAYYFFLDR